MSRSWIGKLDLYLLILIVIAIFVGGLYIVLSKDNYKNSYAVFEQGENIIEYSIEYKLGSYYKLSNNAWIKVDNTTVIEKQENQEIE